MTFFKQITLLLATLLLIILLTVLLLNFKNANESIQSRLYEDAQNTASSLSLSLGTANGDISTMQTMINANFDSGNYALIALVDNDEKVLFKRVKEQTTQQDTPQWFRSIVTIEAPVANTNVSAGWSPVGILQVQSDDEYAYKQLYGIFIDLLVSFGIIFVVSLLMLYILLLFLLKPLENIQKQAEAIVKNEFILQEKIPFTKEFKDVVLAMNAMVKKVQSMFEKANEELKQLKEREYTDSVTKLKNRKYFINKLPEFLKIDARLKGGTNVMIALSGVIEANKKIGYRKVDEFFVEIATVFHSVLKEYNDVIIARMNGTEFSILIPDCNLDKAVELTKKMQQEIQQKIDAYELDSNETFLSYGLYEYNYKESISDLLKLSDSALAKAKLETTSLYYEKREQESEVMGKDEWRDIIKEALEKGSFDLIAYKVLNAKTKSVVHETLTITLIAQEKRYAYGQFIASAMQIGLVDDIYRKVFELLLSQYNTKLQGKVCSLRLSNEFLEDKQSFTFIKEQLVLYASRLQFKLIVEIPDKFITTNAEQAKLYKELFEEYGIAIGIFEFIGESSDYYYLQEFKPVYIKSEKEFFLTLESSNLNALKMLADSIDIDLIAFGVMEKETLAKLQERSIDVIQGRVVDMLINS